jgi:glutaredoxin
LLAVCGRDKIAHMHEVVVYSRRGCHLCDVVKNTLQNLQERGSFHWREVDIDEDPELRRLYGDQIPVVFVDGRKSFKYHMTESDFLRRLEG